MCTCVQDGTATGPSKKHKGAVCKAIPDDGATRKLALSLALPDLPVQLILSPVEGVELYASSSAFSLQFATDSKCKDLTGEDYYGR